MFGHRPKADAIAKVPACRLWVDTVEKVESSPISLQEIKNMLHFVIGIVSTVCVLSGAVLAHASRHYPSKADRLEVLAGVLLVGGLALLGYGLTPIVIAINF